VSAGLHSGNSRGFDLLLAHCATLSAAMEPRRPVFDRLHDLLGVDLTRLLLVGLTASQRARAPRPL